MTSIISVHQRNSHTIETTPITSNINMEEKCINCNINLSQHSSIINLNYNVQPQQDTGIRNHDCQKITALKKDNIYKLSGLCLLSFLDNLSRSNWANNLEKNI